jgi:alpha-galactosidase
VPHYGSEGHEQQDMDTFAAWGFDAVKIDYCGGRSENLDPATEYGKYRYAIDHNSSGRPMLLNICDGITGASNTAWKWAPGIGQSWRTSDDEDRWATGPPYGVLNSLDGNNRHPEANGPNHWNDPDYLLPELHGLSLAESRSQFSLWCMMSAPLIAGNDLRGMAYEIKQMLLNRELIAVDQDPAGIQGTPVAEDVTGLQVWSKRLSLSGSRAVALFNRTEDVARMTVRFADCGIAGQIRVRDLWEHANMGTFTGSYSADVEPHATVVLRLTGGTEIPVITLPHKYMTAVATSNHPGDEPGNVLDDNVDTIWHSEYEPTAPLPQSITIDLGGQATFNRLRYLGRNDYCPNGHTLSYLVYVGNDGIHFGDPVASGRWADNTTEKKADFPTVRASYIRLETLEGVAGFASAAELNVDYVDRSKLAGE